jgi:hypothetical protein
MHLEGAGRSSMCAKHEMAPLHCMSDYKKHHEYAAPLTGSRKVGERCVLV